jgi:hypothetical protein
MVRLLIFSSLLLFPVVQVASQENKVTFGLETVGGYSYWDKVPFWLRSNHYGSIPPGNVTLGILGSARKDYDLEKSRGFDWGAAVEGRFDIGKTSFATLVEGYGKIRLGAFEFRAGRSREIMGLCDTLLTSGSFSISGNALGIPKIQVSVPEFTYLPFLNNLFAMKGNYVHGWLGEVIMHPVDSNIYKKTYLHQKSLYVRFGKPAWKLKLYGGFNHQVFWGNERSYAGEDFELSPLESYLYVIIGKSYSNKSIADSKVGNHLGSFDLGLEYNFEKVTLLLYRQNFYDASALFYLANIADGLNGLSLANKSRNTQLFRWKRLLFEFVYTKNQAGQSGSPDTPTPYEQYYNHYQYAKGWSYNDINLGNPFMTTRTQVRQELPSDPWEYFINNRVIVFHLGFEGSILQWNFLVKGSWSKNYGTYSTTDEDQTTDIAEPGYYGIFGEQNQLSTYLACERPFGKGFVLKFSGGFDAGELYYNTFGAFCGISKTF